MIKLKFLDLAGMIFLGILFSCTNDLTEELNASQKSEQPDYLSIIVAMGFDVHSAIDKGAYYLVEDDIMLGKKSLVEWGEQINSRQARTEIIVADRYRFDITIKIDSSVNSAWEEALLEAMEIWNATEGVYMRRVTTGNADILVTMGETADYIVAEASFPTANGKPGESIFINSHYRGVPDFLSPPQQLATAVHELGHCLGFRHTNWRSLGESGGIKIPKTPDTGSNPDPDSFINGGNPGKVWKGFSRYDKIAIEYLYPAPYRFTNVTENGAGAAANITAGFYCKEEVKATITLIYNNPIYNPLNPFKIQFSGGLGAVNYSGSQSVEMEQTVNLPKGMNNLNMTITQLNYNQEAGTITAKIFVKDIKSVATGELLSPNIHSSTINYQVISKDGSGQV